MTPMDNNYRPPGGDPGDHQPTEQFWPGQGMPPGSQGPGYPGPWPQQQPGPQAHMAKDHRRARNWTVGIALAALLAGGGVIAGVALGSPTLSSAPAANTSATGTSSAGTGGSGTGSTGTGSTGTGSSGTAGATGQAALLDSTLNAADSPDATVTTTGASAAATGGPATGTGAAVAGPLVRRCARAVAAARAARLTGHPVAARRAAGAAIVRCRFLRRRIVRFFLLRGIDGEFTFRTASGTIRTIAYERGVIESVNGSSSITVQGEDGTTSTWDLVSNTVVRELSGKVSESSLAVGEPVWVGGPVVNGVRDARLIFVRPPSS
jgi:hypothetical protein